MTPFEKLVQMCPHFVFRNKTNMAQQVNLKDNDSIMVMPQSWGKIASNLMLNLPDKNLFELKNPTVEQLQEVGIITVNEPIVVEEKVVEPVSSGSDSKKK